MEHAIGTRIIIEVVEDTEDIACEGCIFGNILDCNRLCDGYERTDGKNIIYKEVTDEIQ